MTKYSVWVSKKSIVDFFFILFFLVSYLFLNLNSLGVGQFILIAAIVSNIEFFFRFKKIDFLFIFLFFGFFYWIYLIPYYFFNLPYHYLLTYQTLNYTTTVILLQSVFLRLIFFNLSSKNLKPFSDYIIYRKHDIVYLLFFCFLILIIPVILITTPITLDSNYSIETKSSILTEYSIIFLLILGLYSDSKRKKIMTLLISGVFLFIPLLFGKRLAFLMIGLLIYNLFFSGKYKIKTLIIMLFSGFILLRLFALVRIGISNFDPLFLILGITSENIMSNNHGGVIVCSVTYFGLLKEGIFDLIFRIKSLLGILFGVFLPSSFTFEEAFINLYTLKYVAIPGNGGLVSIYFFVWGGLIGVFIGGWIFNRLIRNQNNSRLVFVYLIFMFSTFPRWYSYNILILVKMGFWLILFLAFADTLYKYLKKENL